MLRLMAMAAVLLAVPFAGCLEAPGGPQTGLAEGRVICPEPCRALVAEGSREPSVAVNPSDPTHIVASSIGGAGRAHVSHDGGRTWRTVEVVIQDPNDPERVLAGGLGDMTITVLGDGTVLYLTPVARRAGHYAEQGPGWVDASSAQGERLVVARSTDGGLTYPEQTVLDEDPGVSVVLACAGVEPAGAACAFQEGLLAARFFIPRLAQAPNGTLLLAWGALRMDPAEAPSQCEPSAPPFPGVNCGVSIVTFALSYDGGVSWTPLKRLAEGYGDPFPAVRSDGTFTVAMRDSGAPGIALATSRDAGATWDIKSVPGSEDMAPFFHQFAIARGTPDRAYLVVPVAMGESGTYAPLLLTSPDGGASWSSPVLLDRPEHPGFVRVPPALAVDGQGVAYVSYYRPTVDDDRWEFRVVAIVDEQVTDPLVVDEFHLEQGDRPADYMGIAGLPEGAVSAYMTRDGGFYGLATATVHVAGQSE